MEKINIKDGGKHEYFEKKNRSGLHPSSTEKKASQKIQQEISSMKAKCKELE